MFEFLSSANKFTIETQIDYFERAIKEAKKTQDTYYPDQSSPFPGNPAESNAPLGRPSEQAISKAREWIGIQRASYSGSGEIMDLCNRWETLLAQYQKRMEAERAGIQAEGAAARADARRDYVSGSRKNTRITEVFPLKSDTKKARTAPEKPKTAWTNPDSVPPESDKDEKKPDARPATPEAVAPAKSETAPAKPKETAPTAPVKPEKPASAPKPSAESVPVRREFAYSKGGKFYVLGKNGTPEQVRVETFPKELVGQIEKMESVGGKFADLFFLLSAYSAKYPEGKYEARTKEVAEALSKADPTNTAELEKLLEKYVGIMTTDAGSQKKVKEIFAASSEVDRKIRLHSFVRKELGQYDLVSSAISERAMADMDIGPKEMAELTALARQYPESPKEAVKALKASGTLADRLRVNAAYGNDEKAYVALFQKLSSSYADAKAHLRKIDADISGQIRETLKKENRLADFDKEKSAFETRILERFLSAAAAREILTNMVSKRGSVGNAQYELFKSIEGVGALVFSDRTTDIGKEIGLLVATELAAFTVGLATAGMGAWAINAAVYGSRGLRLAERYSTVGRVANSAGRLATGTRFIAGTALEGALFYEGANVVQNVVEKRDWFEGAGDKKEILKSMLFIGALKGFAKLSGKIPGLTAAEGDGAAKFVLKGTTRITLEGLAIGGIAGGIEVAFEGGEWTREQFIEGIIMALVLRGLGKLKDSRLFIKPTADRGVAAHETAPAEPSVRSRETAPQEAPRAVRQEVPRPAREHNFVREKTQVERDIRATEREIETNAGNPQQTAELQQKLTGLRAELRELEAFQSAGIPRVPETPAATEALNRRAAEAAPVAVKKFEFANLLPESVRAKVKERYGKLSHGLTDAVKATPGKAWDITSSILFGNTHGNFINRQLSRGKGPIFAEHGAAADAHGHGKGLPIAMTLTLLVNEANKINDAGSFQNWVNQLVTLHGATAEVIDLIASVGFVKAVGWARMLAYNSMSEKYLDDDDWSTNLGTKAADWMYGPAVAPKK
ncbi:MAG: hypothetical protein QG650_1098 [Patescibacteria group bacterium]|nr:hypothetical protein [Patescibacteria group bacterium]